jgi:uncharacterized protein YjbI with pentapeptide repeats
MHQGINDNTQFTSLCNTCEALLTPMVFEVMQSSDLQRSHFRALANEVSR